jgi:hypothetical protein
MNKTVSKIVDNVRANGLIYFATIAIIYMIYNVIMTAKESYCNCEECKKKEYFSEYIGDKDNVGYISTNVHKCNQPVFRYGVPGAPTKQRVPYL